MDKTAENERNKELLWSYQHLMKRKLLLKWCSATALKEEGILDRIVVIDNDSTDATFDIASKAGLRSLEVVKFIRNWALFVARVKHCGNPCLY